MNEYVYVAMVIAVILLVALYFSGLLKKVAPGIAGEDLEACNLPNMVKTKEGTCVCDASKGYFPTFFDPYDKDKKDEIFDSNINNNNCVKCPLENISPESFENEDGRQVKVCDLKGLVDREAMKFAPQYATIDDKIYTSTEFQAVQDGMKQSAGAGAAAPTSQFFSGFDQYVYGCWDKDDEDNYTEYPVYNAAYQRDGYKYSCEPCPPGTFGGIQLNVAKGTLWQTCELDPDPTDGFKAVCEERIGREMSPQDEVEVRAQIPNRVYSEVYLYCEGDTRISSDGELQTKFENSTFLEWGPTDDIGEGIPPTIYQDPVDGVWKCDPPDETDPVGWIPMQRSSDQLYKCERCPGFFMDENGIPSGPFRAIVPDGKSRQECRIRVDEVPENITDYLFFEDLFPNDSNDSTSITWKQLACPGFSQPVPEIISTNADIPKSFYPPLDIQCSESSNFTQSVVNLPTLEQLKEKVCNHCELECKNPDDRNSQNPAGPGNGKMHGNQCQGEEADGDLDVKGVLERIQELYCNGIIENDDALETYCLQVNKLLDSISIVARQNLTPGWDMQYLTGEDCAKQNYNALIASEGYPNGIDVNYAFLCPSDGASVGHLRDYVQEPGNDTGIPTETIVAGITSREFPDNWNEYYGATKGVIADADFFFSSKCPRYELAFDDDEAQYSDKNKVLYLYGARREDTDEEHDLDRPLDYKAGREYTIACNGIIFNQLNGVGGFQGFPTKVRCENDQDGTLTALDGHIDMVGCFPESSTIQLTMPTSDAWGNDYFMKTQLTNGVRELTKLEYAPTIGSAVTPPIGPAEYASDKLSVEGIVLCEAPNPGLLGLRDTDNTLSTRVEINPVCESGLSPIRFDFSRGSLGDDGTSFYNNKYNPSYMNADFFVCVDAEGTGAYTKLAAMKLVSGQVVNAVNDTEETYSDEYVCGTDLVNTSSLIITYGGEGKNTFTPGFRFLPNESYIWTDYKLGQSAVSYGVECGLQNADGTWATDVNSILYNNTQPLEVDGITIDANGDQADLLAGTELYTTTLLSTPVTTLYAYRNDNGEPSLRTEDGTDYMDVTLNCVNEVLNGEATYKAQQQSPPPTVVATEAALNLGADDFVYEDGKLNITIDITHGEWSSVEVIVAKRDDSGSDTIYTQETTDRVANAANEGRIQSKQITVQTEDPDNPGTFLTTTEQGSEVTFDPITLQAGWYAVLLELNNMDDVNDWMNPEAVTDSAVYEVEIDASGMKTPEDKNLSLTCKTTTSVTNDDGSISETPIDASLCTTDGYDYA